MHTAAMRIHISNLPQRLELRSRHDAASAHLNETVVPLRSAGEAQAYLRRHCGSPGTLRELRQLVSDGRHAQGTMSDDAVLAEIGRRIASGGLILISGAAAAPGSAGGIAESGPPPSEPSRRPPVMTRSAALPTPRTTAAPAPVAAEPEDFADVAQDNQAQTLEQGAANGTPFCEVCEKAGAAA
jgi:hypothetical protein